MQNSEHKPHTNTNLESCSFERIACELTELLIWHFFEVRKTRLSYPLIQQIKATYVHALGNLNLTNNALAILCTFNYFIRLDEKIGLGSPENFDKRCLELLVMAINFTYKYLEDDEAVCALKRWQTFFPKRASNARSTKLLYPSIKELNKLEAEMLKQLEYRLHLRGSLEHFIQLLNKLIATKNMFYELGWKELQKYARSSQKKMLTFKQYEAWCQITYKSLKELTSDPHEENVESPSSTRWSKHHTFKHDVSDITHKIKKVQL